MDTKNSRDTGVTRLIPRKVAVEKVAILEMGLTGPEQTGGAPRQGGRVEVFTPITPQAKGYLRDSLLRGGKLHNALDLNTNTITLLPDAATVKAYYKSQQQSWGIHESIDDMDLRLWPLPLPLSIPENEETRDEELEGDEEDLIPQGEPSISTLRGIQGRARGKEPGGGKANAAPQGKFSLPTVRNQRRKDDETRDEGYEGDERYLIPQKESNIPTYGGRLEEMREDESVVKGEGEEGEEEGELIPEEEPNIPTLGGPPEETQDDAWQINHPRFSKLRIPGHSRRSSSRKGLPERRELYCDKILSATPGNDQWAARRRARNPVVVGTPRRSARLAAKKMPLEVFHRYVDLPPELQWMIWEAVAVSEPRLVYICNRLSTLGHASAFGVQNKLPLWFMTCRLSVYVAARAYKKLFAPSTLEEDNNNSSNNNSNSNNSNSNSNNNNSNHNNRGALVNKCLTSQHVYPSVDIVVYEPCHGGCRAYYCARQYDQKDREQVRYLAVQIDSPCLSPMIAPGWETVSAAWPNVETLYMMRRALRGPHPEEKAMLRIAEGPRELTLRERFEVWKKQSPLGKNSKLIQLEFVIVVRKEPGTTEIRFRYLPVTERSTGRIQDVILG